MTVLGCRASGGCGEMRLRVREGGGEEGSAECEECGGR